jgi:hypothetical protein
MHNKQELSIIKNTKEKLLKTNAAIWNCAFIGVNGILVHKLVL